MSFGLKNARATCQQLVNKVFITLIGKTIEVYVNHRISKSINEVNHVQDLEGTFKILKHYGMKLNPKKCPFRVKLGKFLGYMINQQGIEVNPNKVQAMLKMKTPTIVKDVQKLTNCIAAP